MSEKSVEEISGKQTRPYDIVQSNYSRIVKYLKSHLTDIARIAFEKKLITADCLGKIEAGEANAGPFVLQVLNRIDADRNDFYIFIDCLRKIPDLMSLTTDLTSQLGEGSVHDSSTELVTTSSKCKLSHSNSLAQDSNQTIGIRSSRGADQTNLPEASTYIAKDGVLPSKFSSLAQQLPDGIESQQCGLIIPSTDSNHGAEEIVVSNTTFTSLQEILLSLKKEIIEIKEQVAQNHEKIAMEISGYRDRMSSFEDRLCKLENECAGEGIRESDIQKVHELLQEVRDSQRGDLNVLQSIFEDKITLKVSKSEQSMALKIRKSEQRCVMRRTKSDENTELRIEILKSELRERMEQEKRKSLEHQIKMSKIEEGFGLKIDVFEEKFEQIMLLQKQLLEEIQELKTVSPLQ